MKRMLIAVLVGILVSAIAAVPVHGKSGDVKKQEKEVLEVLKKFQAGYTLRDASKADAFAKELFDNENVVIIGTSATKSGDPEWCEGIEAVTGIIKNDWIGWGDLKMEIEKARIRVHGDTAWVTFWGVSEVRQDNNKAYDELLENMLLNLNHFKGKGKSRRVVMWAAGYAAYHAWEYERGGEEYVYPVNISAVLVKKKGKWRFTQMNYSFPVWAMPPVRIVK